MLVIRGIEINKTRYLHRKVCLLMRLGLTDGEWLFTIKGGSFVRCAED